MTVITAQQQSVSSPFASIAHLCGALTNVAHAVFTLTAIVDNSVTLLGDITNITLQQQKAQLLAREQQLLP